jgi:hypothetical protein
MRIRNFYRSRPDLDKMQGVRQFLVPIVTKFYNGEVEGAQRLKDTSLPTPTLFNCMETILARLNEKEYPELLVGEIWDDLRLKSQKPSTEHRLVHFFDFNYYEYRVNRWFEATVIFGAVYFVMAFENPDLRCCLSAIKNKAVYSPEAIPYFNVFEKELARRDKQPVQEGPDDYDPRQDIILELKMRTERAMNDFSNQKPPEGYVSIDALLYATEHYFYKDADPILNTLEYVVSQTNGSELDRIRAKRNALAGYNTKSTVEKDSGMTTGQQVLFFYYIFDSLGLNFHNSDKAAWIRLLQSVTGRNKDNIKKRLDFRFDDDQTQKDLRIVAGCLKELFPSIATKIERDSSI